MKHIFYFWGYFQTNLKGMSTKDKLSIGLNYCFYYIFLFKKYFYPLLFNIIIRTDILSDDSCYFQKVEKCHSIILKQKNSSKTRFHKAHSIYVSISFCGNIISVVKIVPKGNPTDVSHSRGPLSRDHLESLKSAIEYL